MENNNIQLSWFARDLTRSSLPFPVGLDYKRHLGGVATAQYVVTPELWTWSWRAWVGVVPNVHKDEVSDPSIPVNNV
jgi:hypothetical protein